ncbi:TonB-dependent receptor [Caulobacter sp. UNC279MFTsu5.1]|uniref:TonB-dependent receptor n=1 Tax=Caulobacter sp. UNC279MFTsu5.1 TaxID=1502775 RepID=UPI0008E58C86|nr:TonB-dependent receptor [Caulobacter sp. UNC279MFTsu5.1]SFI51975.1 TonB-dependent Receptor Plug Domain [Caulobacter sp. UNC279MFTsu5.1]
MTRKSLSLLSTVSISVLAIAAPAIVSAQEATLPFALPSAPMKESLLAVAKQSNTKILFESELVAGLQAPKLDGRFTARQAIEKLVSGSGIAVEQVRPGVVVLKPRRISISTPTQAFEGAAQDMAAVPSDVDTTTVAEVVVGTHIRGVKDTASPVVVLGRDDMDKAGYSSIAEALTLLPQAFGGTASEDTVSTGADPNGSNVARGTGVDLRGLGAEATLVLFNGKRMAGAGYYGDFTDISSIPFAAVGRVEVLLDGASALYGADAVGGVVNIKLRTDLHGGETRASGATATRGGYSRYLFSQALGQTWDSGHVLAAYEYTRTGRLRGADRDFAGYADLRALGGTDWRRSVFTAPGNILRPDATGAYVATYAIPAGQNGVGLKPSDFVRGTANLENQRATIDIMPKSERHSAVISAEQDVGRFQLSTDLRFAHRETANTNTAPVATMIVSAANPYFVSPTGQASERIAYSFSRELGGVSNPVVSESLGASLGAETKLPAGWNGNLFGTYAQELAISRSSHQVNSTKLNEALGATADSPLSSYSAARDGYFNPFIGQGSNAATVLDFVLSGWDVSKFRSTMRSANLAFDGPLFSLPGGAIRLAIGGQLRREALRTGGASFFSGYSPTAKVERRFSRDVRSAYAELNVPLVGASNAMPLVERLELSLAGRIEDYDDVGSTRNPKVGVIWEPGGGLTVKASYGTSFRAPSLPELNLPFSISPIALDYGAGQVPTLFYQGGNTALRPETAKSWTGGVSFTPPTKPELTLGLNVYRTKFTDRIASPVISSLATALTSSELAPFRTFISPSTNAADLARVQALIASPNARNLGVYPATDYRAIVEARNVNTGSLDVSGVDASAAYRTSLAGDPLVLNASLSWLMHYRRKITPASVAQDLAGRAGYPADLRARVSATWTHDAFSVTTGLNHLGDTYAETGRRVQPWTTLDLQLHWQPERLAGVRGLSWSLNVQNLFDTAPPFYDNPLGMGYDPTNADPLGRMVTLQLTKAW